MDVIRPALAAMIAAGVLAVGVSASPAGAETPPVCDDDQLVAASLARSGPVIEATWETSAPPAGDLVVFTVTTKGSKKKHGYIVGLKSIASTGETIRYVFDLTAAKNRDMSSAYTFDDTLATLVIPRRAVRKISNKEWTATLEVDGQTVGTCTGRSKLR